MVFCSRCGTQNPDDGRFCTKCGAELASQLTPARAEPVSLEGQMTRVAPPAPSLDGLQTVLPGEQPAEICPGHVVHGRYEVLAKIGAGGMGAVYRARDRKLPRDIALKVLLPSYQRDSQVMARFRREAEVIAQLNHTNIVQIHDADDEPGLGYFIALEFVDGGTLHSRIREKGKLDVAEAAEVAKGILRALSCAHGRGVVHRDLKPGNVLMTTDGTPKVTDFGLASLRSASELSMTGYGLGTPYYMAPEQRRDAKSADERADLYSFGATLYEMVSGEAPSTVREARIPQEMRAVILACMEEQPARRPDSAQAVLTMMGSVASSSTPEGWLEAEKRLLAGDAEGALRLLEQKADSSPGGEALTCLALMSRQPLRRLRSREADEICGRLAVLKATDSGPLASFLLHVMAAGYYQPLHRRIPDRAQAVLNSVPQVPGLGLDLSPEAERYLVS